jgi:hypothetical protein
VVFCTFFGLEVVHFHAGTAFLISISGIFGILTTLLGYVSISIWVGQSFVSASITWLMILLEQQLPLEVKSTSRSHTLDAHNASLSLTFTPDGQLFLTTLQASLAV